MQIDTRTILQPTQTDDTYGSVGTPIYLTSNFRFRDVGQTTGYDYTRSGNPTRHALETVLADLESGTRAVAVSSGMSAISTVLSHFPVGSHIVATHDCYGGTARLLNLLASQGKLSVSFVRLGDLDEVRAAVREHTRCVWIETPSNPLLEVVDVAALAAIAHECGALVVVDNTLLSPTLFRPLEHGADVVVHSTTKWINGHSDVVSGAIVCRDSELGARFAYLANAFGTTTGAFDSWVVLRGTKTLTLRMKQHEENAQRVAAALQAHPDVTQVYYPGLASHESHALAKQQFDGFGGLISFRVGSGAIAEALVRRTKIFTLAESLGGVESLIELPAQMSHASMPVEQRHAAGITDDLIRISVGIEDGGDLVDDLRSALNQAVEACEQFVRAEVTC